MRTKARRSRARRHAILDLARSYAYLRRHGRPAVIGYSLRWGVVLPSWALAVAERIARRT